MTKIKEPARRSALLFLTYIKLKSVFRRNSKFLAAVTATCRKNATAIGCTHTLTKAVLVYSLAS